MNKAKPMVALITGGGSGIGRATAIKFSECGYKCAVADLDVSSAKETVSLLKSDDGVAIEVDVGNAESVQKMVATTVEKYGRIDVAFNNAGIEGVRGNIVDYAEEDFDHIININLKGIWLCMKYEITQMLKQDLLQSDKPYWNDKPDICQFKGSRGSIVNCSSTAALGAMPQFSGYCASKWGSLGLTKTIAQEYGDQGIRINAVCPATTMTPMRERFAQQWPDWQSKTDASYPVGRVAVPEEVAEAVYWLASDSCPFVSGEYLKIGGGR